MCHQRPPSQLPRARRHARAHRGGDEFAILIAGEVGTPEIVADQLRVALRSPFSVHGTSIRVRASMGLVSPGASRPGPPDIG